MVKRRFRTTPTTYRKKSPEGVQYGWNSGSLSQKRRILYNQPAKKTSLARKLFAGASGAALGYIHGNIPGAVAGAALAQKLAMRRNGTQSQSRKLPIIYRKHGPYSAPRPRAKKRATARSNGTIKSGVGGTARNVVGRKSGNVSVLKPNRRLPSVSRKFKKAVKAAVDEGVYNGNYKVQQDTAFVPSTTDNIQSFWYYFGNDKGTDFHYGDIFRPKDFLYAASVLWNGKGFTTLDSPQAATLPSDTKFFIKNSWRSYKFTNLTFRTMRMRLYECASKKNFTYATDYKHTQAYEDYVQAAAESTNETTFAASYNNVTIPANFNFQQFNTKPEQFKQWTSKWKCNCVSINLEPGQTYTWFVQGPKGMQLDIEKAISGSVFEDFQKYSRSCFVAITGDLISSTIPITPTANPPKEPSFNAAHFGPLLTGTELVCEVKDGYVLGMPKNAGFGRTATTTGFQVLDQVRDARFHAMIPYDTANASATPATQIRVDSIQPAVVDAT